LVTIRRRLTRSALQSPYPQSAATFDAELARAQQSLDPAKARSDYADSAMNMATTNYVQQCPQHFAGIHGDYLQLVILAAKAASDPNQLDASK
jgi:hypothetical protein